MERKDDFGFGKGLVVLVLVMFCVSMMGVVVGEDTEVDTSDRPGDEPSGPITPISFPGSRVVVGPGDASTGTGEVKTFKDLKAEFDKLKATASMLGSFGPKDETLMNNLLSKYKDNMSPDAKKKLEDYVDSLKKPETKPDDPPVDSGTTGGTPSGDTPSGASPPGDVVNPEVLCPEDASKIGKFNEEELGENLGLGEEMDKEKLKEQWCAFQNSDDKQAKWKEMSEGDRNKFMEAVGEQYGIAIDGIGEGSTWEGENLVIDGKKINMDLEKFYGDANKNTKFGFRGDNHIYDRKAIRGIDVGEDGSVKVSFGGYGDDKKYTDASSLTLNGADAEFNPETMEITSGGKKYEWNGQGEVDFGDGKLSMKFAPGKSSSDITNFPIMRLEDKTEVSPFQEVSGKKGKDVGLEKTPSKGYLVSDDGKYTIDQYGTVREIMDAEVTIEGGEVKAVKNSFLGMESLEGDLFTKGEYGIGEGGDYDSFINLKGNELKIVSADGSDKLYYHQGSDLKKIDASGKGTTYIRNGDYILKFEKGEVKTRLLPKVFHKADGKYGFTADEIVNGKDKDDPYKIITKDGKKVLTNNKGEPVDISTGKVKTPGEPGTTTTSTTTTSTDGPPKIESSMVVKIDPQVNPLTYQPLTMEDGVSNIGKLVIDRATWDSLTADEKKLDSPQLLERLVSEGKLSYEVTFDKVYFGPDRKIHTFVAPIAIRKGDAKEVTFAEVKETMGREGSEVLNPLFAQFGPDTTKVNTGDKLAVSLNGGSASITFRGKTVTADSSQNAFIQNVIRKELTTAPTAPPIPKAKITFTGHTGVPMESIYSSYEVQHKALHP